MELAFLQAPAILADWARAALLFAASMAVSLLLRQLLMGRIDSLPKQSLARSILRNTLRFPSFLWCLAGSVVFTLGRVKLPGNAELYGSAGAMVFLVVSICVVTSSLLLRLVETSAQKRAVPFAISGVVRALIHVFVLLLGTTALLRYFDVNIAPLLAALGVGGLAVALALRDTLANFFAGIHIVVEAPISIGDFIKLSSGEEGTVTDIGWRTTRVLTGSNNIVVIPNEKITSSILTNYALPDARVVAEMSAMVASEADVRLAMKIAGEEAARLQGTTPGFEPVVIFDPGVLPTHIQFKVVVHVENRLQQGAVLSNLRLRLLDRFREENIKTPGPERLVIAMPQEKEPGNAHRD